MDEHGEEALSGKKREAAPELSAESRIVIPTIGSRLVLTRPWAFMLHHEYRNMALMRSLGLEFAGGYDGVLPASEVILPVGTKLTVDRIYIRKGVGNFDSLTFILRKGDHPSDKKIGGRFWVKLGDVNRIACQWYLDTLKTDTRISILTQLAVDSMGPTA